MDIGVFLRRVRASRRETYLHVVTGTLRRLLAVGLMGLLTLSGCSTAWASSSSLASKSSVNIRRCFETAAASSFADPALNRGLNPLRPEGLRVKSQLVGEVSLQRLLQYLLLRLRQIRQ